MVTSTDLANLDSIYIALVAELGEPDLTPAPDYEVTAAQAVLAMAGNR